MWTTMLLRNITLGARALWRRPAYAILAAGTIAIGVAASVSLYTIVDGVLLRALPFRDPERLVAIWQTNPEWRKNAVLARDWDRAPLSLPQYGELARQADLFAGVAAWREEGMPVDVGARAEYARVTSATVSMMHVLGMQPALGRYFVPPDAVPGGARVALISDDAWRAWFGGEREILGRSLRMRSETYTIVGVLPRGFTLDPRADGASQAVGGPATSAVWIPAEQDTTSLHDRAKQNFRVVARLQPGRSLSDVEPRIAAALHPDERERRVLGARVAGLHADQTREARGPLLLLLVGAAALLVVACANAAILVLGESATREREIASRVALGASRRQVVRQLLAESTLLAIAGATAGVVLAAWATRLLVRLAPERIVGVHEVSVGAHAVLFAVGAAAMTALAIGVVPAWILARLQPADVLRQGSGQSERGRDMMQRTMIAVQFGLSIVLLVSSALLYRSFRALTRTDPGFGTENLIVVQPELPMALWGDTVAVRELFAAWNARLAAIPGVTGTTATTNPPFVGGPSATWIRLEGENPDDPATKEAHPVQIRVVTHEYFATLGIPVRAGRAFTGADASGAPEVVLVSQSLADRDFGGRSPIGARIRVARAWRTVVGVVGDVRFQTLGEPADPAVYYPHAQSRSWTLAVLVRTAHDPRSLVSTVRRVMTEVEPRTSLRTADIMASAVARSFADERYRTTLMLLFALVATTLATIGVYGVTMRTVARRHRELAIRRALGASRGGALRPVLRSTLWGLAAGGVLGVVGAIPTGRALMPYLYQVDPADPLAYGTVLVVLTLVTFAAMVGPAIARPDTDLTKALRLD